MASGFRAPVVAALVLLCGAAVAGQVSSRAIAPPPALGTYLGGALDEHVAGIGVDGAGNIHVVGITESSDFPTVPPAPFPPPRALFSSTLDPTGGVLLSSVVLQGFTLDIDLGNVHAVAVDAAGNVLLTGFTLGGLPVMNAAQPVHGGGRDAFVTKLDAQGAVVFSTYLGGGGADTGTDVAVDAAGRVHVVGTTSSGTHGTAPFPVVAAWQDAPGGFGDAFVAQLDAAGVVQYATYLGGAGAEGPPSVATNASGATWVAGPTTSAAFPTTGDAWRPASVPGPFVRSADGGGSWTASATPLRADAITALAVAPGAPPVVYAGTTDGAIVRSTDGGDGWTLLHRTASAEIGVLALAVDPGDPAAIYAAVGTSDTSGTVLRTLNGGADWAVANVGLPAAAARSVVVDPHDSDVVYAVMSVPFGLYRSDDRGEHWAAVPLPDELLGFAGVPGLSPIGSFLIVDPRDPSHLVLAAVQRIGQSFDRGATWTVAPDVFGDCSHGSCSGIGALALAPAGEGVMYVGGTFGFAKSTDGGLHWDPAFGCLAGGRQLVVDPSEPGRLYGIGTVDGRERIVRSQDGGASWAVVQGTLPPDAVPGVLVLADGALLAGLSRPVLSETFVTKLDAGGAPVFSTYAGVSGSILAVDGAGNVFLPALGLDSAGQPRSPFAVPSHLDPASFTDLAVDGSGRVHVFGRTSDAAPGGQEFTAVFDPTSPDVGSCTLLPGAAPAAPSASPLVAGAGGDTYVAITTSATDLAVPGAHQPVVAGGTDAYVARIAAGAGGPLAGCPPPSTTTTSLPPAPCGPAFCGGGLGGARCRVADAVGRPLCLGKPVADALRGFVAKRLARTLSLLDVAATTKGRRRVRALRRSRRQLVRVERRAEKGVRRQELSPACEEEVRRAMATLREAIAASE